MNPLSRVVLPCIVMVLSPGCASLFPRNVRPQPSVFVDSALKAPVDANKSILNDDIGKDVVEKWFELNDGDGDTPEAARQFLYAGVSLVDARCNEYFRQLGLAAQKVSFANKELGLTTSVVAAIQGLTAVGSKDIALTSASLGYVGASVNAYADVYIFSPEVSSVQALVEAAQKTLKDKIEEIELADYSKASALGLLQDYEKTCEVHTIRRLVNESLAAAEPVALFSSENQGSAMLRQATRTSLAIAIGVPTVTGRQMIALYWLALGDALSDADKAALRKLLPQKVLADTNDLADTKDVARAVKAAFVALVNAEEKQLAAELDALRKEMLPADGTPPAAPGAAPATPNPAPEKLKPVKKFLPTMSLRIKKS